MMEALYGTFQILLVYLLYQHCPGYQEMPIMLIIMDASLIRVQYNIIVSRRFIGQVLTMSTNQTLEYPRTVSILILGYDNGMHKQV